MCDLHTEVPWQIALSNDNWKYVANLHDKLQEFAVGDEMMLRVGHERFPLRTREKFYARHTGPYRVLKRIDSNTYGLDESWKLGINPHLQRQGLDSISCYHWQSSCHFWSIIANNSGPIALSWSYTITAERFQDVEIEDTMLDGVIWTADGHQRQRYLVCWKGCPRFVVALQPGFACGVPSPPFIKCFLPE